MRKFLKNTKGFTLIEILLVIAIIAVLSAAVIIAINPAKSIADARNAQRRSDTIAILDALSQINLDGIGLPANIPINCTTPVHLGTTAGMVDLTTPANKYIPTYMVSVPMDPTGGTASDTKYTVCESSTNPVRFTVAATVVENNTAISVSR